MRLFLALEPDEATRRHIAQVQQQVLGALRKPGLEQSVRPVVPEQCHLTLLFLGDVEEGKQAGIERHLLEATCPLAPQVLEVARLGAFPNFKAPRVLWLGVGPNESLQLLHADLAARLAPLCPQMDAKPLRPHFTLARAREMEPQQKRRLAEALAALPQPKPVSWTAREVCLIRSQLTPQGPLYSTLLAAPLASAD